MKNELTPYSAFENQLTIRRLVRLMQEYDLKKADIARYAKVSRTLVTRWFNDERRCPDDLPETIRVHIEISPDTAYKLLKRPKG